jgi:hypothetical protein
MRETPESEAVYEHQRRCKHACVRPGVRCRLCHFGSCCPEGERLWNIYCKVEEAYDKQLDDELGPDPCEGMTEAEREDFYRWLDAE